MHKADTINLYKHLVSVVTDNLRHLTFVRRWGLLNGVDLGLTLPQSLNILRYPSLKFWESGVILGTVKSGLEKLQIRSKT